MSLVPSFFKRKKLALPPPATPAPQKRSVGGVKRIRQIPYDAALVKSSGKLMQRMYEAALTTNLNSDQPISLTSSNAEILTSQIAVRSRARTTERNNPYGAAMIIEQMRNVCGPDPFPLEMKVGNEDTNGKFTAETDTNKRIQDAWEAAGLAKNCCPSGTISRRQMYWTAIASIFRDGGALFRIWGPLNDIPKEFLKLPPDQRYPDTDTRCAIEPIEIDRLDQNWARPKTPAGNNNEIQFGIEYNHWKRRINYHILTRHPGDIFSGNWNVPKFREAVPARDIICIDNIHTRAEQLVGISSMAPVIRLLHQLEQFDIAHVTAAMTACCKSIWIEKAIPSAPDWTPDVLKEFDAGGNNGEGGDGGNAGWEGDGWGGGQGQPFVNTTPGEMNLLPWGNKVVALEPRFPMESATPFKKDILRAVASACGVWYNQLAQDMESVNFASGRLGENASRDIARMYQEHMIDMLVRPHFETWLRYAMISPVLGDLPMARYEEFCKAAVFHGRRWEYTNPMQDVQADILSVEAGLNSRSRIISESPRGGDAEEVNREQQADRESDKKHGLDFSAADVTKPTIGKGMPGEDKQNPFDAAAHGQGVDADTPQGATQLDAKPAKGKSVDLDRLERLAGVFERLNRASDPYGDHDTLASRAEKAEKRCQELQMRLAAVASESAPQPSAPPILSPSKRNGNGHVEGAIRQ